MAEPGRLRAVVHGRVQGVGFRYFVLDRAQALGLKGWVRNTGRDEVEVLAEGDREALEELLTALRAGPCLAWVERVIVSEEPCLGDLDGFTIEATGW